MSHLSRRLLVATAAALPALAVPALASFNPDHPDAELLRLAVRLEAVGQELDAENELCRKHSYEWDAACERAGLTRVEYDPSAGEAQMERWREYVNKSMAFSPPFDEEKDENGETRIGRIMNRLCPIANEILELQARTLDGLRVQARALALRDPEAWDISRTPLLAFLTSVFTLLGVDESGKPLAA